MESVPNVFRDGFALLVGVGYYVDQRLSSLPATVNDARELEKVFIDPNLCSYPRDQVHALVNASPGEQLASKRGILKGLRWLKDHTSETSTVVIYFSGHGISVPAGTDNGTAGEIYYLLPGDYNEEDTQDRAISSQELSDALDLIAAQKMLIILDCCRSGGFELEKTVPPALPPSFTSFTDPQQMYSQLKAGRGRVVLLSCDKGQSSWLTLDKKHSIFTYYLLEALKGQASQAGETEITAAGLFEHVSKKVPQTVRAGYGDEVVQKPQINYLGERFVVAFASGRNTTMSYPSNTPETPMNQFNPADVDRDKLAKFMESTYNDREFETLCVSLRVHRSLFAGIVDPLQRRYTLIDYFERRGTYEQLVRKVMEDRPGRKNELLKGE